MSKSQPITVTVTYDGSTWKVDPTPVLVPQSGATITWNLVITGGKKVEFDPEGGIAWNTNAPKPRPGTPASLGETQWQLAAKNDNKSKKKVMYGYTITLKDINGKKFHRDDPEVGTDPTGGA